TRHFARGLGLLVAARKSDDLAVIGRLSLTLDILLATLIGIERWLFGAGPLSEDAAQIKEYQRGDNQKKKRNDIVGTHFSPWFELLRSHIVVIYRSFKRQPQGKRNAAGHHTDSASPAAGHRDRRLHLCRPGDRRLEGGGTRLPVGNR